MDAGARPGSQPLTVENWDYIPVFQDENVSIGIFLLAAGCRIPLHNHPDQRIIARLLYGHNVRVISFDTYPTARCLSNAVLSSTADASGPSSVFLPSHPIHSIHASSDSAFLDVIAPPYDSSSHTCSYYSVAKPADLRNYSESYLHVSPGTQVLLASRD